MADGDGLIYEFSENVRAMGFPAFAEMFWKVSNKDREMVPFVLQPPQLVIWANIKAQMDAGLPVRIRILKARQQGVSLFSQMFLLWWTLAHPSHQSLSIANRLDLPQQWIRHLRRLVRQLDQQVDDVPELTASNKAELMFDALEGARYLIGSSLGVTPGMGETISVIHCSEIASWLNPDAILNDLLPAMPPTAATVIIQESTGRAVGDWFYCRYYECDDPDCEYQKVFLPWYLSPEYDQDIIEKRTYQWSDLEPLSKREAITLMYAERYQKAIQHLYKMPDLTPGQMMWRRKKVAGDFHGDVDAFANQYPSCELEAFLSEGRNVFTQDQVKLARDTQRPIKTRYDISFKTYHPKSMRLEENEESGELCVFEDVDERYHYVIGADCQWGTTDRADFDALYVQCLETDRIVARCLGKYDLALWGKIIAGLGWHYNTACIAPERNAQAANAVIPLIRGVSSDWVYPNIYIRRDRLGVKVSGPKGYGWHTDLHTKGELMSYAKTETLEENFDWCDEDCVDQMMSYIWDEQNKMTAPTGAHDDLLMARLITAYVAYHEKPNVTLHIEKEPAKEYAAFTPVRDRLRWMMDRNSEDYDEFDEFGYYDAP